MKIRGTAALKKISPETMAASKDIDINKIMASIEQGVEATIDDIATTMEIACIEVVKRARMVHTYKDQTGNLRSSIGYCVYKDGKRVSEGFEAKPGSESGQTGIAKAKAFTQEIAKGYAGRTCAIIVAGMDYAVYVEGKGFDVLTGSARQFADIFKQYMEALAK